MTRMTRKVRSHRLQARNPACNPASAASNGSVRATKFTAQSAYALACLPCLRVTECNPIPHHFPLPNESHACRWRTRRSARLRLARSVRAGSCLQPPRFAGRKMCPAAPRRAPTPRSAIKCAWQTGCCENERAPGPLSGSNKAAGAAGAAEAARARRGGLCALRRGAAVAPGGERGRRVGGAVPTHCSREHVGILLQVVSCPCGWN